MSKVLQERGFGSLPSSTETNPRDHVKSISTTVEADTNPIYSMGSSQYVVSTRQNNTLMYETRQMTILFPSRLNDYYYEEKKGSYGSQFLEAYSYEASNIDNSIPQKEKDPGSFTLPCYINNVYFDNALADLGASKYPKGIAENVLVGIGKFVFPVDFIILDMPEDIKVPLILGRPFLSTAHAKIDVFKRNITLRLIDPLYGDYIDLNDLNVTLELRRDQVDDLMPIIKEGEVIEGVKARNDARMVSKIFRYPSDYDQCKKIRIDYAHNFKFLCMIGFELIHANFLPNLPINVMPKNFYNSIMKDKIKFKGRNELGNWANVPIFIGNFCVLTSFAVVENMDPYVDEGMGEVCNLPNGAVTSNEQYNKIPPLLKVSEEDKMNRISHSYQKLKRFYKGVLNLGPDFIRDSSMEEWLTCGHVSVHEMKW
ncbi:putative reverse transcriptase domain-containing protein [Tanacetum coccineum]